MLPTASVTERVLQSPPMGEPIRILIAEDNDDLRAAVISLIDAEPDMTCVAQTAELDDVRDLAAATAAHLVVLDIELKGKSSLRLLPQLRRDLPNARFLIYSGHALSAVRAAALAAGACAYVLKSGDVDELVSAVRACMTS